MRIRQASVLFAVVVLLATGVAAWGFQDKGAKPKNGGKHGFHGVIHEVKLNGGKGSITVRHADHGKAKGNDKKKHEKTFTVDLNTKVAKQDEKGGDNDPARFGALHKGEHVTVDHTGTHADRILLHKKKKK
jgi:hypothetical protein